MYEWSVKVFHESSNSSTTITRYADSVEDIQAELKSEYEDDNSWVFVSATLRN